MRVLDWETLGPVRVLHWLGRHPVRSQAVWEGHLVSGGELTVWNLHTGERGGGLPGHRAAVSALAVVGQHLVSGSADGELRVLAMDADLEAAAQAAAAGGGGGGEPARWRCVRILRFGESGAEALTGWGRGRRQRVLPGLGRGDGQAGGGDGPWPQRTGPPSRPWLSTAGHCSALGRTGWCAPGGRVRGRACTGSRCGIGDPGEDR